MAPAGRIRARLLAAPLLAFALTAGAVSAAAPTVVGIAAAVINDVRIKGAAARQYAKAAVRQRVALADQVQTGSGGSRLQLLLLDKSKFTVGPNARLTIDRFVYDPKGGSMSASVAKGAFRFMSGRSGGAKSASISSPAATIGIRGTLLDGAVGDEAVAIARGEREIPRNIRHDPATATLVVLRGPGPRRQGRDAVGAVDVTAAGKTVTLDRPLLAAYVPYAGAEPIGPFSISSPGIARLNDLLLEPKDVVYDPNAAPLIPPPGRERRDPYDYPPPPPGGFGDDGPPPRGGGSYIPGLPNLNSYPDRPVRPERQPRSPRPPSSTTPTPPPDVQSTPTPPTDERPSTQPYPTDDPPVTNREPRGSTTIPQTSDTPGSTVPQEQPPTPSLRSPGGQATTTPQTTPRNPRSRPKLQSSYSSQEPPAYRSEPTPSAQPGNTAGLAARDRPPSPTPTLTAGPMAKDVPIKRSRPAIPTEQQETPPPVIN